MEAPSKDVLQHHAHDVHNGFVMGAKNMSDSHVNLVSSEILLGSESIAQIADFEDSRPSEETELPESLSDGKLANCDENSQENEVPVICSPPGFLPLTIKTDSPTPPACLTLPTLDCLSPLTPTSKFHKSVLSHEPSSLVVATVLCNWDNIFGPKVRCIWITEHEKHADLKLDLLNFIANQTLSGEIMHDLETPALELKLYISSDRGIILATLIFGAESKNDVAVHSLSVIVPYSELERFLLWKDVCLEWMQRTVQRLRIELTKNVDAAFKSFRKAFVFFIRATESAIHAGFPRKTELLDTVLHPHHVFDGEFVRQAIVGHLFQCQQTVVLGNSPKHIYLMINTLSMFTLSHRKHRCQLQTEETNNFYSPEFCLQGLLKTDESIDNLLKNVFLSRHPTALVDLSEEKVSILCLPGEYAGKRRKFTLHDLNSLIADEPKEKTLTLESTFEPLCCEETLVTEFLKKFHSLPLTHGVREIFVKNFVSSLQRKALLIIQLTEREMQRNSAINVLTFLPKLRLMLSLGFFCDLTIVLCVAEHLKPGIMEVICGGEPRLDRLMP